MDLDIRIVLISNASARIAESAYARSSEAKKNWQDNRTDFSRISSVLTDGKRG